MSDTAKPKRTFEVIVLDMFDYGEKQFVGGFPTLEIATEYARRRTRDSVEEQRPLSKSSEDLKDRWFMFGEDCVAVGGENSGSNELDSFIVNPATPEQRNWASLQPVHDNETRVRVSRRQ